MAVNQGEMATMTAASSSLLARLHPGLYLSSHLAHDARPGMSRSPLEFPEVDINLGPISSASSSSTNSSRPSWVPSASALANFGSTTVICNITSSIVYPSAAPASASTPSSSVLVPSLSLTPLSSPSSDFKSGAPSNFAQFTTEKLFEFIDSALPFDPAVLSIPNEEVSDDADGQRIRAKWCLFADCSVIGFDGALLEASALAIVAALRQVWLPQASFSIDENVVVASPTEYWSLASKMDNLPLAFGFGIYENKLLSSPSSFESDLCATRVLLNLSYDRESSLPPSLSALHSTGPLRAAKQSLGIVESKKQALGFVEDEEVLAKCIELAQQKGAEIAKTLLSKEQTIQKGIAAARM